MSLWIKWICLFPIFKFVITEERNFRVIFDNISLSNVDPEVFERFDCELYQIDNRSYVDTSHIFRETVTDLKVHAALDFWKAKSPKMTIYDIEFDGCHFLQNVHKNRLFNIYAKNLKKYSNISFKCPFQANVLYAVKNMTMNEDDFPSFLPLGKFRSLLEYSVNQKLSARAYINGKIISYSTRPF
ncbi:uncharacterized protein LOC110185032 [Drosophila serrata]|uniref:uncharacterized protein LOC110185032 n=1 Tax=Drosophila serrata TaxID=7274 RepID=UPI000A1D15C1|nr:uncharacterized protein LOC110185032 [Drosophila serrata]